MLILGIDPGLANCGWGIIEADQGKGPRLVDCGVFKTKNEGNSRSRRLSLIKQEIDQLILNHHPAEAAIEELFFFKNKKTAFAVSQSHGVISLGLEKAGIPVFSYTPLQIKLALTGYGKATKKQIQYMTQKFLGLAEVPAPNHSADALAVALTHLFQKSLLISNKEAAKYFYNRAGTAKDYSIITLQEYPLNGSAQNRIELLSDQELLLTKYTFYFKLH